jgi:hypothetical protein
MKENGWVEERKINGYTNPDDRWRGGAEAKPSGNGWLFK